MGNYRISVNFIIQISQTRLLQGNAQLSTYNSECLVGDAVSEDENMFKLNSKKITVRFY